MGAEQAEAWVSCLLFIGLCLPWVNDSWARPQYKQGGPHPQGPSSLGGSNQEEREHCECAAERECSAGVCPVKDGAAERSSRGWCSDSEIGDSRSHHCQLSIRRTRGQVLFLKPGNCGHLVVAGATTQGKSERKKYPGFSLPPVASRWRNPSCPGSPGEAAPRGSSLPSEKAKNGPEAKQGGDSPRVHH